MSDGRVSRWMGLLGLLTVVVIFVGFGPLSGKSPGENASGASFAAFYNAHVAGSWASIYVVGLGLALLLLFVSHLRTVVAEHVRWADLLAQRGLCRGDHPRRRDGRCGNLPGRPDSRCAQPRVGDRQGGQPHQFQ